MTAHRLAPRYVARPWGSTRLSPWFPDPAEPVGEVWFEAPPILVKFLFTTSALSVQVHPPDDVARRLHHSAGKTEMWHILAAEPGAAIAAGFRESISAEQLRAAAVDGSIEQWIEWHAADPGDTFFIPAGLVHAIGAGLTLCEIQQFSDVTYRLYDWGRKPERPLHIEESLAVARREREDCRVTARVGELVRCPYFVTERIALSDAREWMGPSLFIVLTGSGTIEGEAFRLGEVWQIGGPVTVEPHESVTALRVTVP